MNVFYVKKFHWLTNGVFPCNIGFTVSRKAFDKVIKCLVDDPEEYPFGDDAARMTIVRKPKGNLYRTFIITLDYDLTQKIQVAALVAHEAVHVAQYLWDAIGEDRPGDEAEAYLVQSIVKQILSILWDE